MRSGVLLLAHGAPERIEDLPHYLTYALRGRPVLPSVADEVCAPSEAIGGLAHWTRVQADVLEGICGMPVYYGMRNWHPFIQDAVDQAGRQSITRLSCVCLTPQYFAMSVGLYRKHTEAAGHSVPAREWLGPTVESVIDRCAAYTLFVRPIGFVGDHVEMLDDIDIHFREHAAARGIKRTRPESLNGSPTFTRAPMQAAQAPGPSAA